MSHLYPPHAPAVNGEDTSDDELGPNFGILNNLPTPGGANTRGTGLRLSRLRTLFEPMGDITKAM